MQGLADDRIGGIVPHVGTPLSVQVGSARQRRPNLLVYGWFLPSALSPRPLVRAGFVSSLRLEREVTVQPHCLQGSALVLDNGALHLGVSLCPRLPSRAGW